VKASIGEVIGNRAGSSDPCGPRCVPFSAELESKHDSCTGDPVSLIGTFIFFIHFGFTINTLTLFAFVLAIGIVVDDAIVVVEAVQHNIDHEKLSPKEATRKL
jgi:hypothetical protein